MKKLVFKVNCQGSQDGIHVQSFKNGQTYEICDALAEVFLYEGMAVLAESVEEKTMDSAPDNKSMGKVKKVEK